MSKQQIQHQFGNNAPKYVSSPLHASGKSLELMLTALLPQPDWKVLDIATGGGHTAKQFASYVQHVVASDLTFNMLLSARTHLDAADILSVSYCQHDAETIPFVSEYFDCVTCRIAPHHFPDISQFIAEAMRVLKPHGFLAVADNVISGEPEISKFVNTFEKLRDPSHNWAYSVEDWETFFFSAGLTVTNKEAFTKKLNFDNWAARMNVAGGDLIRLKALLLQAPEVAKNALKPTIVGNKVEFTLHEMVIIGQKS